MLHLTPAITAYLLVVTGVFGLIFGSFCNAWAWRVANHEHITRGRSHCAKCGHTLSALDLIPLFSWLSLRGKCRYCKEPISPRYPIVEAVCMVYFLSVLLRYDVSWAALRFLAVGCLLLVLSLVDLDTMELPDGLTIALAAAFVLRVPDEGWRGLTTGLLGLAAVPVPLFLLVLLADKVLGKETMGGGDLKLLGALGLHFSPALMLVLLILACIMGLVLALISGRAKRSAPFPFGPAIALAAWVTLLWGQLGVDWYLGLFF